MSRWRVSSSPSRVAAAQALALLLDAREIGLDDRGAVRCGAKRASHVLGDRAPHARERLGAVTARRRGLRVGAHGWRGRLAIVWLRRIAGCEHGEHILLAHAASAAGAGDGRQVDAVLGGDSLDHGRVDPARAALPRARVGRCLASSACVGRCCPGGGGVLLVRMRLARGGVGRDAGQRRAHRHGLVLGHEQLCDAPGRGRGHVGVDLVRRYLADDLVLLHPISGALVPHGDGALGDRHAHLWHRHEHLRQRPLSIRGAHDRPP